MLSVNRTGGSDFKVKGLVHLVQAKNDRSFKKNKITKFKFYKLKCLCLNPQPNQSNHTYIHAFIQSDLHYILSYTFTFLSVLAVLENQSHDLGVASTNTLLFELQERVSLY